MIVSTTIDLSPDIYRFFMDITEDLPDTSPEDFMAMALTLYAVRRRRHIALTKKACDIFGRLQPKRKPKNLS